MPLPVAAGGHGYKHHVSDPNSNLLEDFLTGAVGKAVVRTGLVYMLMVACAMACLVPSLASQR